MHGESKHPNLLSSQSKRRQIQHPIPCVTVRDARISRPARFLHHPHRVLHAIGMGALQSPMPAVLNEIE